MFILDGIIPNEHDAAWEFLFDNKYSQAASCSFGMIPSKMASSINFFILPIWGPGLKLNLSIISFPSTGLLKARNLSRASTSFAFFKTIS